MDTQARARPVRIKDAKRLGNYNEMDKTSGWVYLQAKKLYSSNKVQLKSTLKNIQNGWIHFSIKPLDPKDRLKGKNKTSGEYVDVYRNSSKGWSCTNKYCSAFRAGRGQCKHIIASQMKLSQINQETGWDI